MLAIPQTQLPRRLVTWGINHRNGIPVARFLSPLLEGAMIEAHYSQNGVVKDHWTRHGSDTASGLLRRWESVNR